MKIKQQIEIINELISNVEWLGGDPYEMDVVSGSIDKVNKLIKYLESKSDQESGWIKCSDRLPEEKPYRFEKVLVSLTNKVVLECYYNTKVGKFMTANYESLNHPVTHWMPLPEPPK